MEPDEVHPKLPKLTPRFERRLPDPLPPSQPPPDGLRERPDVRAAIAEEAERRGLLPEQILIESYADVTWPDSSLGCPEPGMQYTQAVVPGHLLVLGVSAESGVAGSEVMGEVASYHAAVGRPFRRCGGQAAVGLPRRERRVPGMGRGPGSLPYEEI